MPRGSRIRKRRSIRLPGYDYSSPGAYFVTINTHLGECLFGEIHNGEMQLNDWGEVARAEWVKTPIVRPEITLDEFQIMPNHIHAIVSIMECEGGFVGATRRVAPTASRESRIGLSNRAIPALMAHSVGAIMAQYKSIVTKRINRIRHSSGVSIWQRNYYEHIIRNEYELSKIREYIRNNPAGWGLEKDNQ